MQKRTILTVVLLVALVAMMTPGCGPKVSQGNYDKIETGMALDKVQKILGPGEQQTGIGSVFGSGKVYKWTEGELVISITFIDDKVTAKAQKGF